MRNLAALVVLGLLAGGQALAQSRGYEPASPPAPPAPPPTHMLKPPAAPAPSFNAQDSFAVMKRLEPVLTAKCLNRTCTARDGGLSEGVEPGSFGHANAEFFGTGEDRPTLGYNFLNCRADKTGCTKLEFLAAFFGSGINPQTVARWNKGEPECPAFLAEYGLGVKLAIALSRKTTFTEIELAREKISDCKAKFEAFAAYG